MQKIKLFNSIFKLHKILGLFLALNFLTLSLTGTVLIWKDELTTSTKLINEQPLKKEDLLDAYSLIQKEYPNKKILSLAKDDNNSTIINIRLTEPGVTKFSGATKLVYNKQARNIINLVDNPKSEISHSFFDTTLRLHREILLGGKGKYLIGLIGLLITFVLLSGVLLLKKFNKDNVYNIRTLAGRLHQSIGTFTFSWLILVTVTGVFLSFNGLIINLYFKSQMNSQVSIERRQVSFEKTITYAFENLGQNEIDFISFPDNEFSTPTDYTILLEEKEIKRLMFISKNEGQQIRTVELPWLLKTIIISEPLHYGNFGGIPLKVIWTIFSLLSSVLPFSASIIFLIRKGRIKNYKIKKSTIPNHLKKIQIIVPAIIITLIYTSEDKTQFSLIIVLALFTLYTTTLMTKRLGKAYVQK